MLCLFNSRSLTPRPIIGSFYPVGNFYQQGRQGKARTEFGGQSNVCALLVCCSLSECRKPLNPQPLLDYTSGGKDGWGWQQCIAARWDNWKWNGDDPEKIFYLAGNNHIERGCNSLAASDDASRALLNSLLSKAKSAAKAWWEGLVAEPRSFQKPTFYLGLNGQTETNVIVDGAFERTPGRVTLQSSGATGFSRWGDHVRFKVKILKAGYYLIGVLYSSTQDCSLKASAGSYEDVVGMKSPALKFKLPKQVGLVCWGLGMCMGAQCVCL